MRPKTRKNSTIMAIAIAVMIPVLVSIILSNYYSSENDFADVGYKLSADEWIPKYGTLEVDLKLKNDGNIDCVPTSTVFVENATIQGVKIEGIQQINLWKNCNFTDRTATIFNLNAQKEMGFNTWATVTVVPDAGATSFAVYSTVTLPSDLLHPKSETTPTLPYELFYAVTNQGEYVLAE